MEAVKEVFTVIGVIVGVLTGLVTLYAKYLDLKKKAAREADDREPIATTPAPRRGRTDEFDELPVAPRSRAPEPAAIAQARLMVQRPATALMIAGGLGLLFNLFLAGFGFVNEFVTPLGTKPEARKTTEATKRVNPETTPAKADAPVVDKSDRAAGVMVIVMYLGFSAASAVALWAGYGMLRLRSYWLSVAGSFAVMPGACACCLAGFPIGVWSLMVLLKPEVSASFR